MTESLRLLQPLGVWTLRAVCAANINEIVIYDDLVEVGGTREDADNVAAEFSVPSHMTVQEIADYFGVPADWVTDKRTTT